MYIPLNVIIIIALSILAAILIFIVTRWFLNLYRRIKQVECLCEACLSYLKWIQVQLEEIDFQKRVKVDQLISEIQSASNEPETTTALTTYPKRGRPPKKKGHVK